MDVLTADNMVRAALKMVANRLKEDGEVHPVVYLHMHDELIAMPYMKGRVEEDISRRMILVGIKEARRARTFQGAVMVMEAWGVTRAEAPPLGFRPSEQADRHEVVVVHAFGGDGSRWFLTYPLIRDPGQPVRIAETPMRDSRTQKEGSYVRTWLDEAFTDQQGEA